VLADVDSAPIDDKLRMTLRLLRKLTTDHAVTPEDLRPLLAAGVTKTQLADAFAVCFAFNVIDRLADTFQFFVPKSFAFAAKMLLSRGYKM
jgi:alkylhydroperoxidase family enzyme